MLVFALLLTILITLISLSVLGLKKGAYSSSKATVNAVQARSLARAGMTDAWIKLAKDPFFPGGLGDDQEFFYYREELQNTLDEHVGYYSVTIDRRYRLTHEIVRIECTGVAGALAETSSQHTIYAELSIADGDFGFKVWQEGSARVL